MRNMRFSAAEGEMAQPVRMGKRFPDAGQAVGATGELPFSFPLF